MHQRTTSIGRIVVKLRSLEQSSLFTPYFLAGCNRVGRAAQAFAKPRVLNLGRISIGREVVLDSREAPISLQTARGSQIEIGDGTTIGFGASFSAERSIRIGERVRIAPFVSVRDHSEDGREAGRVEIGDGVTVGVGARIEPGATIGDGAEIAAGAIVRGTVAAWSTFRDADVAASPAERERSTLSVEQAPVAPLAPHTGIVIADFTADGLVTPLSRPDFDGLCIQAEVAPFGQMIQTLRALLERSEAPEVAIVWTIAEHVSRGFRSRLEGEIVSEQAILREVDEYASLIEAHAGAARFVFVPSLVTRCALRGSGVGEMSAGGIASGLMSMNLRLVEKLAHLPNVFVLDAQRWLIGKGSEANPKLWHMGKVPFTAAVFAEAARDIKAALRGTIGLSRKLVVVDLDDTLWGGILGDVGWENLALGGHHAEGEAFVHFQQRLLSLSRRGIALAIVSKNDEDVALEALREHPEMVLRPEVFAAHRINRRDKAQNVAEIAAELNLGLSSFVFIDDNPAERSRVREALPEVYVPEWPTDPTLYAQALEDLRCFDAPRLSEEDAARTRNYAVERARSALKVEVSSFDDWLKKLELSVVLEPLRRSNAVRTAQLLNKTNQMNLRTRRLSELELLEWARGRGREVWTARVSDRLGDAGLTGILSLELTSTDVQVEDYVLSCRVMGRRVEEALLWAAVVRARALGGSRLVATPLPTNKNKPCLDFWAGGPLVREGDAYVWKLADSMPPPEHVTITGLEGTPALRAAPMEH